VGRFQSTGVAADPETVRLRLMTDQVVDAIESLAGRQAEVWKTTVDNTHEQWLEVSVAAAATVKKALAEGVQENLMLHARTLNDGALRVFDRLDSSTVHHAEELNRSTVQSAARLREGMERLAELLIEALERHGDVMTANERELADQN